MYTSLSEAMESEDPQQFMVQYVCFNHVNSWYVTFHNLEFWNLSSKTLHVYKEE